VFAALKALWQEAKTDVAREARVEEALREAIELLQHHEHMEEKQRHKFARSFLSAKSHLENAMGDPATWTMADKAEAAEKLRENARNAVEVDPYCAMSIALLSLYYEAQTLPGERSKQLADSIDHWYIDAVIRNIKNFAPSPHRRR
jgi:uncharacterized UPF0160 family protein